MSDQVWFPIIVMDLLSAGVMFASGYFTGRPSGYAFGAMFLFFALVYPENSWGQLDCLLLKIGRVVKGVVRGE